MTNKSVSIIGVGRMGGALAIALARRGYGIDNLISRNQSNAANIADLVENQSRPTILTPDEFERAADSSVFFITTPDSQIESTARRIAETATFDLTGKIFLHTSGALSSEILRDLRQKNARVGSLHPLVSISDAEIGARKFGGTFFGIEGDAEAVQIAEQIAADLGGTSFTLTAEKKSLYHAAAVMSSGHFVALFDAAVQMLIECGLESERAKEILLPLVRSTIENLAAQPNAAALTGTFARADVATFEKHLAALKGSAALPIYLALGKQSIKLAAENNADAEKLAAMNSLIAKSET